MSRTRTREREQRLEHANQLIAVIAAHGRRFFWRESKQSLARLELRRGRVYIIDDYSQQAVYTHPAPFGNPWRGFSHGGTLRSLIEDMRDYVVHGTRIPRWRIVIEGRQGLEDNVWGYDVASAQAVRAEAYLLPIIEPEEDGGSSTAEESPGLAASLAVASVPEAFA